jgi:hypothetical protein
MISRQLEFRLGNASGGGSRPGRRGRVRWWFDRMREACDRAGEPDSNRGSAVRLGSGVARTEALEGRLGAGDQTGDAH